MPRTCKLFIETLPHLKGRNPLFFHFILLSCYCRAVNRGLFFSVLLAQCFKMIWWDYAGRIWFNLIYLIWKLSISKQIQRSLSLRIHTYMHISILEEQQPFSTQTVSSFYASKLVCQRSLNYRPVTCRDPTQGTARKSETSVTTADAPPLLTHPSLLPEWWTFRASCSSLAPANKSLQTAKCRLCAAFQSGSFDEPLFPRIRSPSGQLAETCKVPLWRLLTFQELLAPFRLRGSSATTPPVQKS